MQPIGRSAEVLAGRERQLVVHRIRVRWGILITRSACKGRNHGHGEGKVNGIRLILFKGNEFYSYDPFSSEEFSHMENI